MFAVIWAFVAPIPQNLFLVGTNLHTIVGMLAVTAAFRQLRSVLLAAIIVAFVVQIYLYVFKTPQELKEFYVQAAVFVYRTVAAMAWGGLFWFIRRKIKSQTTA